MEIFCTLVVIGGFVCALLIAAAYDSNHPQKAQRYKHNPNHPGITVNTLTGKKDVICPKCKCPYCMYAYKTCSTPPSIRSKTRTHLLNPFKPLIEEKTTIYPGMEYTVKCYQCKNCGWVFK